MNDIFAQAVKIQDMNPEEALKLFSLLPEDFSAHINAGVIYYNSRRFVEAESSCRKALQLNPKSSLAYFNLANVLEERGRIEEAIKAFQSAIKMPPVHTDAHYNLALIFERINLPHIALKHWQAYIKTDKTSAWSKYAQKRIKETLKNVKFSVTSTENPRRTESQAKLVLVK